MCSRYATPEERDLARVFKIKAKLPKDQKSIIYPGYYAPVIMDYGKGLELDSRFWGFVTRFPGKRDPNSLIEKIMQNAVSETITEKRTFSGAWKKNQRCLIPVAQFMEPIKKVFTPIQEPDGEFLVMAGIYSEVTYKEEKHAAFTMLTCEPNKFIERFHDRMPVILSRADAEEWISPDTEPEQAIKLCRPYKGKLEFAD